MNQLINITVTEEGQKLVSARELHRGLEIGTEFRKWMPRMIDYGFEENQDFIRVSQKCPTLGGRQTYVDYAMSLDMAKQIAMIQRTEIGKQYRQYFIECEKENKVLNHIIDHTIDKQAQLERNQYRFSDKRTIKTFQHVSPLELPGLIEEFNAYIALLDTATRMTRYQSAIKGIERIHDTLTASTVHMLPLILVEKEKLIKANHILENRSNGGIKSHQTRKILSLEEQLLSKYPSEEQFTTVNTHGFSNNYQYRYINGLTVKTTAYTRWINKFPKHELPGLNHIDFTQPLRVYIHYTAKAEMDIRNMDKSFIDRLQAHYDFDDNIISEVISKRYATCNEYKEGQIAFYIENVEVQ